MKRAGELPTTTMPRRNWTSSKRWRRRRRHRKTWRLLAELLSLPTVRYPASTASPQRKKEQTFTALLRQLEALARSRPALMLFEDLHWIDPSSRELLDRMIERAVAAAIAAGADVRPEFQAPGPGSHS